MKLSAYLSVLNVLLAISGFDYPVRAATSPTVMHPQSRSNRSAPSQDEWLMWEKLVIPGNVEGTSFGFAVFIYEQDVVICAPNDSTDDDHQGSAFYYQLEGNSWELKQRIVGDGTMWYDFFGSSVAMNKDTLLIGATNNVVGGWGGSAYFFAKDSDGTWTQLQRVPTGEGNDDRFGYATALIEDTAFIGAWADEDTGSVYVYALSGGSWELVQKLKGGEEADNFGVSVAASGSTLVVGSWGEDGEDGSWSVGAVYAFERQGDTWELGQRLTAPDWAAGDHFGETVAVENNTMVIGAPEKEDEEENVRGAVYIFERNDSEWSFGGTLPIEASTETERFGRSLALAGGRIYVGSRKEIGGSFSGSVDVFEKVGDTWTKTSEIPPLDVVSLSFGEAISAMGSVAVVGVPSGNADSAAVIYSYGENPPDTDSDTDTATDSDSTSADDEPGVSNDCSCRQIGQTRVNAALFQAILRLLYTP